MQKPPDTVQRVQPCATPYGVNADGTPIDPEWLEKWRPSIETFPNPHPEIEYVPTDDLPKKGYHRVVKPITHVVLPMCGHKFVPGGTPRFSNCESCWFAFFQVYGDLTKTATEVFHEHGLGAIVQLRGKKFAKNFTKFMATIAQWQRQLEAKDEDEQSIGGISNHGGQPGTGGSPLTKGSQARFGLSECSI